MGVMIKLKSYIVGLIALLFAAALCPSIAQASYYYSSGPCDIDLCDPTAEVYYNTYPTLENAGIHGTGYGYWTRLGSGDADASIGVYGQIAIDYPPPLDWSLDTKFWSTSYQECFDLDIDQTIDTGCPLTPSGGSGYSGVINTNGTNDDYSGYSYALMEQSATY